MLLPHPLSLLALCLLLGTASARAQQQDTVVFKASYALLTDSNLFRLPASANTQALLGTDSAAERIGVTSVGLSFNKAYSLQRVELDLTLVDYAYQNFDYLSFTARNYNAAWRWSLTPRLYGSLSSDRKETLNSFSDYQGNTPTSQRNRRTNTNSGFDATYELDGTWRLLGGFTRASQTNNLALGTGDDFSETATNVGVRYAPSSNSAFTYSVKASNGKYLNRALSAAGAFDDEFSQLNHELRMYWVLSGNTTANLNAAYISRSHPHFAQRDYSGFNTGAAVFWNITGKTALAASWTHELASFQTSYASYTQTNRLSLGPTLQVGPKIFLGLKYDVARLAYLGAPTQLPTALRNDSTQDTTLSLNWQPYHFVAVSASLKKSQRDTDVTNLPALDFNSHMATLAVQFSY